MESDRLMKADRNEQRRMVEIAATELPLHCPTADQKLWNSHPRVYLPIEETGEALCPYCGTRYVLKGGAAKSGH
jgi:uncharacterized Zn-finger protein